MPVTVPGAPAAWAALIKRFGNLIMEDALKPTIEYATEGYPVSPALGKNWDLAFEKYKKNLKGKEFENWFEIFAPDGRVPLIGERWSSKNHAITLREIASSNGEAFYSGNLADKIEQFSRRTGGYLRKEDLESFYPEWVEPVNINYRGYNIHELPPNGQGLIALIALNILKSYDFTHRHTVTDVHRQIEAVKLAFCDGRKYITDPEQMNLTTQELLSEKYASKRRSLITDQALTPSPGKPEQGGTVYLATADMDGNMVSFIQSNYMGFGSGLVVPETGIALQNRGYNFSLDKDHINHLEPGKRPYHTIIPGFITKDNQH